MATAIETALAKALGYRNEHQAGLAEVSKQEASCEGDASNLLQVFIDTADGRMTDLIQMARWKEVLDMLEWLQRNDPKSLVARLEHLYRRKSSDFQLIMQGRDEEARGRPSYRRLAQLERITMPDFLRRLKNILTEAEKNMEIENA